MLLQNMSVRRAYTQNDSPGAVRISEDRYICFINDHFRGPGSAIVSLRVFVFVRSITYTLCVNCKL